MIVCVTQKIQRDSDIPAPDDLYKTATLCQIESAKKDESGNYHIIVTGLERVHIDVFHDLKDEPLLAQISELQDKYDLDKETEESLTQSLKTLATEILDLLPYKTEKITETIMALDDPVLLSHMIAQYLDIPANEKQEILEELSLRARLLKILDLLAQRKEKLKLQHEIGMKVSQKLGKHQREVLLREQIRALREELGEDVSDEESKQDYRKRIDEAGMPEEARKVALEQLKRLESISEQSPENHVIRNYLDTLLAMPWNRSAEGDIDLTRAREILDKDHHGLDKVKKRIIQHLAVMKLKKNKKGSFLLFVGPPGVGKTSLGQSIATALGRKFVRASLGGVRDDAEIRGHRRTYIGSMPGRIVDGLKRAGENNPVFVLDEIDKLSRGYSGDPASALLEVLDPEQNNKFLDHYLDVPFDLSNVFFIATANSLETIPGPLLDRMEMIELTGYTIAEKLHIAKNHLVPKQWDEHGLKSEQAEFTDKALIKLISSYTREAGVRELQRKIAEIARACTEKVLTQETNEKIRVDVDQILEILGPERYVQEVAEINAVPGVVTGLAWTPVGGEILFVESSQVPGKGQLTLTGQLGDVMKESVQIALTLVRSRLGRYFNPQDKEKTDIHVHVPAGAIPKDGPSAGITMVTSLASLITGRPVNPKLAMTGEITLRGAVMPVGGIKEKLIAAHRAGIEEVILAKRNERHLHEVPPEVRQEMKLHFVENIDQVFEIALGLSAEDVGLSPLPEGPSQNPAIA